MATFSVKTTIHAPIEVVFDRVTDFAGAADFVEGITRVEMLTEGPVRVGTRFRETRVFLKKEATEEMEVTAFDPPNGYTLGCDSCGCRYESRFSLRAVGDDTEVEMTFDSTPQTVMAKVMAVVFRPLMKAMVKTCEKDLADIKQAIESERAAT